MEIRGENVILRELKEEDTDDIVRWRNQEHVRKYCVNQEVFTKENHLKWYHNIVKEKKAVQFIIIDKILNKSIGSTYIRDINYKDGKGEFGIFIGEDNYLSRGIGAEATKLIIQYGFKELGLHKIFLRVLSNNTRAIKCYEKVGFIQEGYFKDEVLIQENYHDLVFMAIFNPFNF